MKRIVIVGPAASGKTTFARQLAERLGLPNIELDAVRWGRNWKEVSQNVLRQKVEDILIRNDARWIMDGNYPRLKDLLWERADTLIWLDYPLRVVLWRFFKRLVRGERLFHNNREQWGRNLFCRQSLFLWLLRTYWSRRREYRKAMNQPTYAHLSFVHLRSSAEADAFLALLDKRMTLMAPTPHTKPEREGT